LEEGEKQLEEIKMKNFAVLSLLFFLAIALTNCGAVPRTLEKSELESNTIKEKPKKKSKSPSRKTMLERENEGF
jgi:starvation-inducible outer membrane lipoprotein